MNNFVSKFVVGVLVLSAFGSQVTSAQDFTEEQSQKAQICLINGAIAKEAMTARQTNVTKANAQKTLHKRFLKDHDIKDTEDAGQFFNAFINGYITLAYQEPIAKNDNAKKERVTKFANQRTRECLRDYVGIQVDDNFLE